MLFPPDFLKRLEHLSLTSRRMFRGSLLAQRRTSQAGSGIEFSEHREYSRGDDLRCLDWNIYARHGDLLLKRFEEEQDLYVQILVDCSASMGFGSPRKFDLARQAAAAIAYIALADLDSVAVASFADSVISQLPVTRGKPQIIQIMQFLESLTLIEKSTHIANAAQAIPSQSRHTGLVIVISDLFDENGFERGLDLMRSRGMDLHIIQLHDPAEADPYLRGETELVDLETHARLNICADSRSLKQYQGLFQKHQLAVRNYCGRHGLGCTQSASTVPYDVLVTTMMRAAARMI